MAYNQSWCSTCCEAVKRPGDVVVDGLHVGMIAVRLRIIVAADVLSRVNAEQQRPHSRAQMAVDEASHCSNLPQEAQVDLRVT